MFYANENVFMVMMNGVIWLRIGSSGRLVYTLCGTFGFYKIRSVSFQVERLLNSQERDGYVPNASIEFYRCTNVMEVTDEIWRQVWH
jgi:hypothetical protein